MPNESRVSSQSSRSMMRNVPMSVMIGAEDVGETLVINRLDRLRIVGDAKTRIGRAPGVVIFERERLQIGVEIGAQLEQRLQADLHEDVIASARLISPQTIWRTDERKAEEGNVAMPIRVRRAEGGVVRQNLVDDKLERPGLEQVHPDPDEREHQPEDRRRQKGPIIAEHAPVDHRKCGIRIAECGVRASYALR